MRVRHQKWRCMGHGSGLDQWVCLSYNICTPCGVALATPRHHLLPWRAARDRARPSARKAHVMCCTSPLMPTPTRLCRRRLAYAVRHVTVYGHHGRHMSCATTQVVVRRADDYYPCRACRGVRHVQRTAISTRSTSLPHVELVSGEHQQLGRRRMPN